MKIKLFVLSMAACGLLLSTGLVGAASVTVTKVPVTAAATTATGAATSISASTYPSESSIENDTSLTPLQKLILLIWWRNNHPNPSFN